MLLCRPAWHACHGAELVHYQVRLRVRKIPKVAEQIPAVCSNSADFCEALFRREFEFSSLPRVCGRERSTCTPGALAQKACGESYSQFINRSTEFIGESRLFLTRAGRRP